MGRRLPRAPPPGHGPRAAHDRPGQPRTARLLRRAAAVAFLAAPLLFLADNLIHPEELERGNEARQLAEIAEHYDRWQIAHVLAFLAIAGFAVAALGLASLVRRRSPRAGLVGGVLALVGILALASVVALDGFTWGVLGEVSARDPAYAPGAREALHEVQQSGWSYQFYVPALGFTIGMPVLAIAAVRSGVLPAAPGYLLALASVLVGTEGLIVSNAYYLAGSAVMLAAGAWVALSLWRTEDGATA